VNHRDGWQITNEHFLHREYDDYDDYIEIQQLKHNQRPEFAKRSSDSLRKVLASRLTTIDCLIPPPANVLCLGARAGGEVAAFMDNGYFATGIDLNPRPNNEFVSYGDFHNLVFPDQSVDMIYTNSFDHVLNIDRVTSEIYRVLRIGGLLLTENKGGTSEPGFRPARSDSYDCLEWDSLQDLIDYFESKGLVSIHRNRHKGFTPWAITFKKIDSISKLSS